MSFKRRLIIRFADFVVEFRFPEDITVPKELIPFLADEGELPEIQYEVQIIDKPLRLPVDPITHYGGMKVYKQRDGYVRVYEELIHTDGCQVACKISQDKKRNVLYYPAEKWKFYSKELRLLHLIGIEQILSKKQAMLLHSSFVEVNGKAVLFSGPSQVGKSTQALLWEKYLGATVLNGDRCVIRKIGDVFYGCGSPWAGTSGIYRKETAPIKGIFILKQANENAIRQLKSEAFIKIYQQCIVNVWDDDFVQKLADLIVELLQQIPVYELSCRPDKEAVELAYNTLFEGGV